jgi:hypothetical protein
MFVRLFVCAAIGLAALCADAQRAAAHFVWIETQPADGALLVRSGFGEAGDWDPELADRMRGAEFWRQTAAGLEPLEMKWDADQSDYRQVVAAARPTAIVASCDFGVVQFGGNPPAWLRYTAKSMVGPPAAWTAPRPEPKLRIEILPTFAAGAVRLKALHLGQPLVGAKIKCNAPDKDRIELLTDERGEAKWVCDEAGLYACYVGATVPSAGKIGNAAYESLKDYATLTFSVGGTE